MKSALSAGQNEAMVSPTRIAAGQKLSRARVEARKRGGGCAVEVAMLMGSGTGRY